MKQGEAAETSVETASRIAWEGQRDASLPEEVSSRGLRRQGVLRAAIAGAAALAFAGLGMRGPMLVAGGLALVLLLSALLSPSLVYLAVDRMITVLGQVLVRGINYLLLLAIFWTSVVPVALVRRRRAQDPLTRAFDRDRPSYWTERDVDPLPNSVASGNRRSSF